MLLLFLAAVPVCLMAGFIAWQNYRIVAGSADEHALLARQTIIARYDTLLSDAVRNMEVLGRDPVLTGDDVAACSRTLLATATAQAASFGNLAVLGADGHLRCSARPVSQGDPTNLDYGTNSVFRTGMSSDGFALAGFGTGTVSGELVLRAALPLRRDGAIFGVLVAGLKLDVFMRPSRVSSLDSRSSAWLVDGAGRMIASGSAADTELPPPESMSAVLASDAPCIVASRGGVLYDYVTTLLLPDLRLLVATPAAADLARAERVLVRRIAELGLLLLVGLGLVAVGANIAVVEPLKRLSVAVNRWRGGGAFSPGDMANAPTEIIELSRSFAQATSGLADREHQLRTAMTQQDLLMQEIHHRVKNNLQIIASLLNLQASRIRLPQAKAEFQSARDRIRALATLHRHLYAHGELHTINMRSFLAELCGQLLQAIGEKPDPHAGSRIRLVIEASELQISSDQAVPMALIVTEAVSNATKYAFPAGRTGTINVRLTTAGETVRLVIEDDGVGIPAGRAETETGIRDGIGIQLIRGFARQLGAKLVVTEDGGTRYDIELTLRRTPAAPDAGGGGLGMDHAEATSGAVAS